MPIPERINFQKESADFWMFNQRRIGLTVKRSILPRRCFISNKNVWFKRCEVVTSMVTGPGDPVYKTFWCDRNEFLLHELKRPR